MHLASAFQAASSNRILTLENATYSRSTLSGAAASLVIKIDGEVWAKSDDLGGSTLTFAHNWVLPKWATVGNLYEVSLTFTGDALDVTSDLDDGTWIPLSTQRQWSQTNTSDKTTQTSTCTVNIGLLGQSTALITKTIVIESENF